MSTQTYKTMTLPQKTQLDLFYDTISQSSPDCMDEEKIKKLEAWSLEKVTELLQAFSFLRLAYIQEYPLVDNLIPYKWHPEL